MPHRKNMLRYKLEYCLLEDKVKESDQKTIEILKNRIHQLENELYENKRAKKAIEAAGFDIWGKNFLTGETFGSNNQIFKMLGYTPEDIPTILNDIISYIHPDDLPKIMKSVSDHFDGKTDIFESEFRLRAKNGSWIWTGNTGSVVEKDEKGNVTLFMGLCFNVDEKRYLEESMKRLAYTDSLTKLGNRRILFESGEHEVERAHRYKHPLSLFLFDIDNFKVINDTHGHLVGDDVLLKISEYLFKAIRQVDIKIRYGGDEFIVLLIETNLQEAFQTAERLRHAVGNMDFPLNEQVTISGGVVELGNNEKLESLIQRCDEALYTAKNTGRNRIHMIKSRNEA